MLKIRAIIFDMYGTLVDIRTNEHMDAAFESISRFLEYRRVFIPGSELKELYFVEINQQIAKSREKNPEVDVNRAFCNILSDRGRTSDRYLALITTQLYRSLVREHLRLFEDTFWTLNEFKKKYRLAIVSDAQRAFCMPELRALRLEDFFDALVISSDYKFRKPDPRMFHIALAMLNREPKEAIYIGNSYITDILGAKAAGLAACGLIRQSEEDKKRMPADPAPDFVADTLRGAWDWIETNCNTGTAPSVERDGKKAGP